MAEHNELGTYGETLAKEYLIANGYTIVEQNWRYKHLEIDLIAESEEYIVFVEVKTRTSSRMQSPIEAVTIEKQNNIIRAANIYIQMKKINREARFDIVSVDLSNKSNNIFHIKNAFYKLIKKR